MKRYEVILSQIPRSVRLALGAHDFVGSDSYPRCLSMLTFRVRTRNVWVSVSLMGDDTYTVRLQRLVRMRELVTVSETVDVYAEQLGEVLLGMQDRLERGAA